MFLNRSPPSLRMQSLHCLSIFSAQPNDKGCSLFPLKHGAEVIIISSWTCTNLPFICSDDSDASSNLFSGQKTSDVSHDVPVSVDANQSAGVMLISSKPLQQGNCHIQSTKFVFYIWSSSQVVNVGAAWQNLLVDEKSVEIILLGETLHWFLHCSPLTALIAF